MSVKTPRATGGTPAGRYTVNYRNVKGRTVDAIVTGPGTAGTLNLRLPTMLGNANRILTNVPKMTSVKQTNVWSYRSL